MQGSEASPRKYLEGHDLMAFAGAPAVYHCHHFNLFLDQTIDDALGEKEGIEVRFEAARAAAHDLIAGLCTRARAQTPAERMKIAQDTFAAMGHGRLRIEANASGGHAHGEFLHYGFSWKEKYGDVIRRRHPADAVAAGFACAATEIAYGLSKESMRSSESQCVAMREASCEIELQPGPPGRPRPPVLEGHIPSFVRPTFNGLHEEEIAAIAKGLRDFTAGVAGDDRGLVQAFGVYVTMHLAAYYNRVSYDTVERIQIRSPGSLGVLEDLLRESGHVCVFNTCGGILRSPEWEGLVGKLSGSPREIVIGCLAIARSLGFGHWTLEAYQPNERLVIRTPSSYETAYYLARHGMAPRPNEYFLQGSGLAIAQLAHRVDWTTKPELTPEFYQTLFHGELPWSVEQTKCIATGDPYSEVVVRHR